MVFSLFRNSSYRLYVYYLINFIQIIFRAYGLRYKTRRAKINTMINLMIYLYARQLGQDTNCTLLPFSNSEWYFSQCLFSLMVCYVTLSKIHSRNFDILVHTPGKFGSAQPMPQLIIPPRNQRPLFPLTTRGPPESP